MGSTGTMRRRRVLLLYLIVPVIVVVTVVAADPFPRVTRWAHDWPRRWQRRLRRQDDRWNDVDAPNDAASPTPGTRTALWAASSSPVFWSRSLLWGLILYGILEVGKMVAASVEELQQQLGAASSTDAAASSVYGSDPRLIAAVLHYCQRLESTDANTTAQDLDPQQDPRVRAACALAQRLHSAGIPYQSDTERSVESLLHGLTAAEIRLLQQSLYVPPQPNDPLPQLIGVSHIQEQLLDTIRHRLRASSAPEEEAPQDDPFASVFATTDASNHHVGILLYGPPGCGKTLLIRNLAQQLQLPCLILTPSLLLHKYFGETNAHLRLLCSLLQDKLAPAILGLDELDGLFRARHDDQHEVLAALLTEFLQWMDGLMTTHHNAQPIILIGATNRPFDVDAAVLRRLPHAHCLAAPDAAVRRAWFSAALHHLPHTLTPTQCDALARDSDAYTYSDLRTWRQAAVRRRRDPHTLTYADFVATRTAPTAGGSPRYRAQLAAFAAGAALERPTVAPPTMPNENGVWKTVWGNYYHLGTWHVDGPAMDVLQQLAEALQKYNEEEEE